MPKPKTKPTSAEFYEALAKRQASLVPWFLVVGVIVYFVIEKKWK